ncbi:MAG: hypothetical protein JJU36_01855, partial [Phycisphaeraceae bacterium]|nr:hypothetical protein [Phycisphaeraceae bacterium]
MSSFKPFLVTVLRPHRHHRCAEGSIGFHHVCQVRALMAAIAILVTIGLLGSDARAGGEIQKGPPPNVPCNQDEGRDDDPCAEGGAGADAGMATGPHPVLLRHGAAIERETDISLPGALGWSHSRSYSSRLSPLASSNDPLSGIQGNRWLAGQITKFVEKRIDGEDESIVLYTSATSKRTFHKDGDDYIAPPAMRATLEHDAGESEYILTYIDSGRIYRFHDETVSPQSKRGSLKSMSNRTGEEVITFTFNAGAGGGAGRINTVTTAQGWQVQYGYYSEGTNNGKIRDIRLREPVGGGQYHIHRKVRFTYFVSESMSGHEHLGSAGDLIMVTVMSKAGDDDLTSFNDEDFSVKRYTQYRYHSDSRLKAVIEHADIMQAVADANPASGIEEPADLLDLGDTDEVTDNRTLQSYMSRSFEYFDDAGDTSNINTVWQDDEDLESLYGTDHFTATDFVRSEIVRSGCGSCGTANHGGRRLDYYYMAITNNDPGPADVVQVIVEDTSVADGEDWRPVTRRIIGLNPDGIALREVITIDPTEDNNPLYWCRSTIVGDGDQTGPRNVVIERRSPSAHTVVNTPSQLRKFLNPTGDDGNNETSTLNAATNSSGVVHIYEYDAKARLIATRVRDTATGNTYYRSRTIYGGGSGHETIPGHLPVERYSYPVPTTNHEDSSARKTTYAYTFHEGGSGDAIKTRKTIYAAVPDSQNGSDMATDRLEYFDESGRRRWLRHPGGAVDYFAYDLDTGGLAFRVTDINTSNMPAEVASPPADAWTAWSAAVPDGFANTPGFNLVTINRFDAIGRLVSRTGHDGVTSYYRHESHRSLVFPGWVDEAALRPAALVSIRDDAGRTIASFQVGAHKVESEAGLPVNVDPQLGQEHYLSLTRHHYNGRGELLKTDVYHNIPGGSATGSEGEHFYRTRFAYDDLGRQYRSIGPDGTIQWTEFDALGRAIEQWTGTDAGTAEPGDPAGGNSNLVLVSRTYFDDADDTTPYVVGDGHVTKQRTFYGDGQGEYYTTLSFRDRITGESRTVGPDNLLSVRRVEVIDDMAVSITETYIADDSEPLDPEAAGAERIARSESYTDPRGQVWKTVVYDQGDTEGDRITSHAWYDPRGRQVKSQDASGLFTKTEYDTAGRVLRTVTGHGGDSKNNYTEATTIHGGNTIIEQVEYTYDDDDEAGRLVLVASYQRIEGSNKTGSLAVDWNRADSRRTYAATWYDALGRTTHQAYYGTNGGNALSERPEDPPVTGETDWVVSQVIYDQLGRVVERIDNAGRKTVTEYDTLGRVVKVIENYDSLANGGEPELENPDVNRTTEFEYDQRGRLATRIAHNPKIGGVEEQKTRYVYGSDLSASL